MSKNLTRDISNLNSSAKKYFQTKVDLIKISLLEKSTKLTSFLVNLWILATLLIWTIAFFAAAFAVWYGKTFNNYSEGLVISGGFILLIMLLFILFRKRIITTSVLQNYSEIMFEDEKNKNNEQH